MYRIERARPDDIAEITDMQRVFRKAPDKPIKFDNPDWVGDRINNFLVIRDEKGLAGCLCLSVHTDHAKIDTLNVRSGRTGQGIGRALLEHAVQTAREAKLKEIRVGSAPRYGARGFYLKHGFQLDHQRSHLYAFEFYKAI